ncbi:hypothetical protein MNBD_GAMMA06-619 [hydrothermal vent metagenome]|uniref:TIGR03016 family PEP-CTERM system-associated outer membrane protein n=1 Tax=hydrothermal vent metagenome TaxID=652676 RepID=A0A3B0WQU2_9ZZZZ
MHTMESVQQNLYRTLVFTGLLFNPAIGLALEFQPGIGVGFEYTDNAGLTEDNKESDLIAIGYVGASLAEKTGPLQYAATTSFNNQSYTQGTFPDQRYFNLAADVDWEVARDYLNIFVSDYYSQRPVRTLNANTPNNIQDSNIITLGTIFNAPISARQNFSLTPVYRQYYYEVLATDNNQYSVDANWNYLFTRLTSVGLNFGVRNIDYTETNALGNSLPTTTFTNGSVLVSSQRKSSNFSINMGITNVQREGGGDTTGFTGRANWLASLTSRSTLDVSALTNLTDTSSVALAAAAAPVPGNPDDVQLSTDVIRNSLFSLRYQHDHASLKSSVWGEYRKIEYSNSPLDRIVRTFGVQFSYPITQLLSSSSYVSYNRTEQLDTIREDERYKIGGNLNYNFSRKLNGKFDLTYRTKESTNVTQNYKAFSVFFSLVYGYGDVYRPSRSAGF